MDGFETQGTKEDEPVDASNLTGDDRGPAVTELERRVTALEEKTGNHEGRISELEKLLRDLDSKLKDLENQMLLIPKDGGSGSGIDADALNKLIQNLKEEILKEMNDKFVNRGDFDDLLDRVERLEKLSE